MTASAAPGWYHAQGDPPGTERYWDGTAWTEGPRPVAASVDAEPVQEQAAPSTPFGNPPAAADTTSSAPPIGGAAGGFGAPTAPPAGFPGAPPSGPPPAGVTGFATYPESSSATTALVLSILGVFIFITAPVGVFLGFREKSAIDAGRRDPSKRGMAIAAIVIGLLITVGYLLIVGLGVLIAVSLSV